MSREYEEMQDEKWVNRDDGGEGLCLAGWQSI